MEPFIHPWYMAVGGALVSSPILIHLINRMRFKRIRWAAMEFLLKSQKRNRRRLIIEQIILLLLRILLVLLAAFLLARFKAFGAGSQGATHLVVIDDTLSMLDRGKVNAPVLVAADKSGVRSVSSSLIDQTAFETGIDQIKLLALNASQARSAQRIRVFLLSEMDRAPLYEGRLTSSSVDEIDARFVARGRKPTLRHIPPLVGLQKGRTLLTEERGETGQKTLHFISDFRDPDWTSGPDAEKLGEELRRTTEDGINVYLIDTATPTRSTRNRLVQYHDNLALVDLRADTRVAIEESDVELTASIMNFSQAEAKTFLQVYVNGENDLSRDMVLDKLPAGQVSHHKFSLRFPKRAKPGAAITEKDSPDERERKRRLDREFFHVRVTIAREEAGLNVDNVRDLVIEVRRKVPSLVVDGNKPEGRGEAGDMSHLQAFAAASDIYDLEERRLADLEKADLDLYPSIILLNVSEIPPAIVKKLKSYVESGGSLCYFMGEEIKPEHYNTELFKAGIFPLKITDRAHDPLAANDPDPDLRKRKREQLRQTDPTPKILFPKADHPLVSRLAPFRTLFRYLSINVYWQALPRSQWDPEPRKAETLVVLPNAGSIDLYKSRALEFVRQALDRTTKLAAREKEYVKYPSLIDSYGRKVRSALSAGELYRLSETLDDMLKNPGVKDDREKPDMTRLWDHPDMRSLKAEISEFREQVLYGDPLVVSRQVGKGRVVAMLTSAGTAPRRGVAGEETVQWNNWGAGEKIVSQTYPVFLLDMQRYLVSEGQAPNRVLGEDLTFSVDAARYDPKVKWTFEAQPDVGVKGKAEVDRDSIVMPKEGNRLTFHLSGQSVTRPGVFKITRTLLGDGPEEDRQETLAFAYNVDAMAEGNLKRADRDRLLIELPPPDGKRGHLILRVPGTEWDEVKERQPDASEWPWLYLFIILILVVEQAMAVHLSHHTRTVEGAPEARPAPAPAAA
jgi:hypothetical protein